MPKALRGADEGWERRDNHSQPDVQPDKASVLENQDQQWQRELIALSIFHSDNPVGLRGVLSARQCFVCRGAGWKQAAGRAHPAQSPREAVGVCIAQSRPVRRTQWLLAPSSVPRGAPRAC